MKKYFTLLIIIIILSCSKQDFTPIDIFEEETLKNESAIKLDISNKNGANTLYVNQERISYIKNGYHIKGTIFSETQSGLCPVSSGDFTFQNILNQTTTSNFNGYGTSNFPKISWIKNFEGDYQYASYVNYKKGKEFKVEEENKELPLLDDVYYFNFKIDKSKSKTKNENRYSTQTLKKQSILFKDFFVDYRDPAVILRGDMSYSKEYLNRNPQNKIPKKFHQIKDLTIGLSANSNFEFIPFKYSNLMEKETGGTGFEEFMGSMYLAGKVPIKKYPIFIEGRCLFDMAKNPLDFFNKGIFDANYRMGFNGELMFGHELINLIKKDLEVELAKATLQLQFNKTDSYLKFAGEYSEKDVLETLLGKDVCKYLPSTSDKALIYGKIENTLSDYLLYIESTLDIKFPGIGQKKLKEAMFKLSKDGIELMGKIDMPYNIGEIEIKGKIRDNGDFEFNGNTECNFQLNQNLSFNSRLNICLKNSGISINGEMDLPYDIGALNIEGGINSDGSFNFKGNKNCELNIYSNLSYNSTLEFNLNNNGIKIKGDLNLPFGLGNIDVEGSLFSDYIKLYGSFNNNLNYLEANCQTILNLDFNSKQGVNLDGTINFPLNIGSVNVIGYLNSNELKVTSKTKFSGAIDFDFMKLPSFNTELSASTKDGIYLSGKFQLPYNLATISAYGKIKTNTFIELNGKLSALNISGVKNFGCNLDATLATNSINLGGSIDFMDLGHFNINGHINNSGLHMSGNKKFPEIKAGCNIIAVGGSIKLNFAIGTTLTQSSVSLNGNVSGKIKGEVELFNAIGVSIGFKVKTKDINANLSITPNWDNGTFEISPYGNYLF